MAHLNHIAFEPHAAAHEASLHAVFVWSADARAVVWANTAAFQLWGVDHPSNLIGQPMDRAMPALRVMARLSRERDTQLANLTLWTDAGTKTIAARITPVSLGGHGACQLVQVADGHGAYAAQPASLNSPSETGLSETLRGLTGANRAILARETDIATPPLSPLAAYRAGLSRARGEANVAPAPVAVPGIVAASSPTSIGGVAEVETTLPGGETPELESNGPPQPTDGLLEADTNATSEPHQHSDELPNERVDELDDAEAMQEIADQIRRALPFANGVETADRFFGHTTKADDDEIAPENETTKIEPTADAEPVVDAQTQDEIADEIDPERIELLANISHEIRNPLNAIMGFSEMMRDERMGPIGSETYKGYAHDIHESARHALSLINDLLDLSKMNAGEVSTEKAPFDLASLIAATVSTMRGQAEAERITLHVQLAEDMPRLNADERQVRQILLNLLSNAIKFTHARGEIIVSASFNPVAGTVIGVRDTGVGMSQAEIAEAMQPFRQVANAPREVQGTGLGLPLVQAMVVANGGRFELSSAQGRGTLARVVFPADDADEG